MAEFNTKQQNQIDELGIPHSVVEKQIEKFETGFPFAPIIRPATIGDGIIKLSESELKDMCTLYESQVSNYKVVKFVPASGAASRMFRELFEFVEKGSNDISNNAFVSKFILNIDLFAFQKVLDNALREKGSSLEEKLRNEEFVDIVKTLISTNGLNYGGLSKGLLEFHSYQDDSRTPIEEHLVEGVFYAVGEHNVVNLHFTVTPEHQPLFEKKIAELIPRLEGIFKVKYEITYSQQQKSTDTIAVDMNNEPFLEEDGSILFRPAGHGALLDNLNDLDADIVFIKNIDNLVPDRLKDTTITYKKAIGGVLFDVQSKIRSHYQLLKENASSDNIEIVKKFVIEQLFITPPTDFKTKEQTEQQEYLENLLNRPVRVCGMVENTGEPGGGPFYIKADDGAIHLQIAETSQLDLENVQVKKDFDSSSHFNPTDLVCAVKDLEGNAFNLIDYRDDETGFITYKSKNGKDLKAQELPGLWNGSMAHWTSLFVEVPLLTFNPVKTVNDLLRDEHQ